ncbi:MAG TPA: helix-turn-helix transcriptional regulator [Promicromonospora sp.]|nr:helix-turn-helix transcriptional regulator [Promicromonospora sp.]
MGAHRGARGPRGRAAPRGHRREAREPLRAGFEAAERIGALALAGRARTELAATGARARRRSLRRGRAPSERRVATLAAEGMTISEIAQALFVTRTTVESHRYGAYRELGVHTRADLAAVVRRG